jgi:phenylpropionate dioxygenase-like ring-hydroxylating dioxygenase large terminal subunit
MFIKNAWYVAAWADEVDAAPLASRILNEPVVVFRDGEHRRVLEKLAARDRGVASEEAVV